MTHLLRLRASLVLPAVLGFAAAASAQDWPNLGGNAARNGLSPVFGPASAQLAWSNTTDFSLIAWAPFTEGNRVFTVRESGFPQSGGAANDAIVAYDLATGAELWRTTLPFNGNTSQQWIAWIAGVKNGRVFASRASNGQSQPITALDAATGATLWAASAATTQAFAYDGGNFAPNGDLIVGDLANVTRIDATSGATVWNRPRFRAVSGNCGVAVGPTGVYLDELAPGGQRIEKLDITTGAILYSSTTMAGFTEQNAPFLSPDGTKVYFSRTQSNTSVDFLFAFDDTGSALVQLWSRPVRWTTSHEHGLASDGSIYTFTQADEFVRLDPLTGNITANAGVLAPLGSPNLSPKTAVDALGRVYVSNGWANTPSTNGRMWAFNADLSQNLFTLNLDNQNQGGPALGADGSLIVCDRFAVRAYRTPPPVTSYCTAGTTTNGCVPSISGTGTPDANAGSGFTIAVANVEGQKSGILFYGITGAQAVAWGTGSSFLCVKAPTQRMGTQTSGGTLNACDGTLSIDWNAFIAANPTSLGCPYSGGETVWAQGWFRDPPSPKTTNLSNALQFTVQP
jgi:sugar lactone lactonase YvrE